MEIFERIKYLRKNFLHLSQEKFGSRLGVSSDVIKNIEYDRLARPEQKEPLLKLICSEFNVNEDWLRNGTGGDDNIFLPVNEEDELAKYVDEIAHGEAQFIKNALIKYGRLTPERKQVINEFLDSLLVMQVEDSYTDLYAEVPRTPEELEAKFPPVKRRKDAG